MQQEINIEQEAVRLRNLLKVPVSEIEFGSDTENKWVIVTSGKIVFGLSISETIPNTVMYHIETVMPSDWHQLFDYYRQNITEAINRDIPELQNKAIGPAQKLNCVIVGDSYKQVRCFYQDGQWNAFER